MVLVSFLLVLAALATLVAGLIQTGLVLVWVSIGCSVLAGLVLTASVLRGRPSSAPAASGPRSFGPTPVGAAETYASASAPSSSSWSTPAMDSEPSVPDTGTRSWERPAAASTTGTDAGPAPTTPTSQPAGVPEPALALLGRLRRRGGQAATPPADVPDDAAAAGEAEPEPEEVEDAPTTEVMVGDGIVAPASGGFPIDDYEKRRATDVISRLDSLSRSELAMVREREASTKNRFSVMSRIDARIEVLGGPDVGVDDGVDVDAAELPIAGYDLLRVGQILPALSDLDRDALAIVRRHEATGRARSTVLDRIDRLAPDAPASAIAMPAAVSAPTAGSRAKKGAPRKAAPRKATARKAAPRKAAAPRKVAIRKAAATRKAAVSKAPSAGAGETTPAATKGPAPKAVKSTPAKKAVAKKAVAKKAVAKKAVAKKASAKKTPAKKAVAKRSARAVKKGQ